MATGMLSSISPMAKYKLVFLGDVYVGKTSIITRFMYETFDNNYQATIGIDFLSKTLYLDDRTVRLQLWDTAGQERFRTLIPNYIRGSSVAVIVFDVTNKQTFDNTARWVEDVKNERGTEAIMVLVGNKVDKLEERCVTFEEASARAKELGAMYIEVSAKTGDNIKSLFKQIAGGLPSGDTSSPTPSGDMNEIKIGLNNPIVVKQQDKCKC